MANFSKYYLYCFNVTSVILSIFIISIALYLRFDWDIRNYIIELGAQLMWTGPYIMIASSSLTILIALFGCSAAIRENPLQLLVFIFSTAVAAVLCLAGLAYALNHGTRFSKIEPWLTQRITMYINEGDNNAKYSRVIRMIQEDLGCCGATGWQDYSNYNKPIPYECRHPITGNMYVYGCNYVFPEYFEPFIGWMSGIGLLLIVLQIFAMMAAIVLRRSVQMENDNMYASKKKTEYTPVRTRAV